VLSHVTRAHQGSHRRAFRRPRDGCTGLARRAAEIHRHRGRRRSCPRRPIRERRTRVGASGNLTCFSFYANKNLSTGDGGAIALFDRELAERLQSLRQNALPIDAWKRFTARALAAAVGGLAELGYKMNYTDLQACIGRVQLARQK
jgi:hypothetical protein